MGAKRAEVLAFLRAHEPFASLPDDVIQSLSTQVETMDVGAETVVLEARRPVRWLYIVRSGNIGIRAENGDLWAQRLRGETFGVQALLTDGLSAFDAVALEESSVYRFPDATFARLRVAHARFDRFFAPLGGSGRGLAETGHRLSTEVPANLIALRVRDLITASSTASPLTIEADRPARDAAVLMRDRSVSCLAVTADGELKGLVTDADLLDRVLIGRTAAEAPVDLVMTPAPPGMAPDAIAYEAVLAMRRSGTPFLPVIEEGRLVGLLSEADLDRRQDSGFGFFAASIRGERAPAAMAKVVAQIPQLLAMLVATDIPAHDVGLTVSSIADITAHRLLQLAEEQLGPPPVPYVWLSSGSQARQEQTGVSDQDNCMILDNGYVEDRHGAYFRELARFVCSGLHACGYDYCPGEMMAMTPKWRQPLSRWIDYFSAWIAEPEPTAQMLSSVMFDLRPIRGETRLFDQLQDVTSEAARSGTLFIAHMAGNALSHAPPLNFFNRFVLSRGGEYDNRLDLKMHGTVPIIDLARVYALQAGVRSANTRDRLIAAREARVISDSGMHDLIDALAMIASVRLDHQARQIRAGERPDNFVSPKELTRIERHHLRDAFRIVQKMQSTLAHALQIRR